MISSKYGYPEISQRMKNKKNVWPPRYTLLIKHRCRDLSSLPRMKSDSDSLHNPAQTGHCM